MIPTKDPKTPVTYCGKCGRIDDIGCACNLTFAEKMKTQSMVLPGSFKAVK